MNRENEHCFTNGFMHTIIIADKLIAGLNRVIMITIF